MPATNARHYDLIVVGGGFAGTAAAIAAAREGTRVLLVEKSNCLGGAPVNNLVNPFMSYVTKVGDTVKYLSRGLFEEIAMELAGPDPYPISDTEYVRDPGEKTRPVGTFDEEKLKLILMRRALAAGVELLFHFTLCGAQVQDGRITAISGATVGGVYTLTADYFIDATGDGNLFSCAGCDYRLGREEDGLCQPMTLCFRLAGVNKEVAYKNHATVTNPTYKKFLAEGRFRNPREDVLRFDTVHDGVVHFNTTRVVRLNPTDPFDVTRAEIEAREQVWEMVAFLRKNAPGYENCKLLSTAMEIGVRESRMVEGEHLLTGQELRDCTVFADSVALGNYDIDIHNPEGSGTSHYYFPAGKYYTIPYRSLIPRGMKNLLVAGRCISATHEAQASIRIMPIVCTLGEAAGDAVSLAVRDGLSDVREVDMEKLHVIFDRTNVAYR